MSVMDRTRKRVWVCLWLCVWVCMWVCVCVSADIVTRMPSSPGGKPINIFPNDRSAQPQNNPEKPLRILRNVRGDEHKKKNVTGPFVTGNAGNSTIFYYRARAIALYTPRFHTPTFSVHVCIAWPSPFRPRKPCELRFAIIMTCTLVALWNALLGTRCFPRSLQGNRSQQFFSNFPLSSIR